MSVDSCLKKIKFKCWYLKNITQIKVILIFFQKKKHITNNNLNYL